MRCPISAAKIRSSKIWILLQVDERLRRRGIDDQRAAMRRGDENFRHLFGIGVHRRRHRQHHAGNRVRQRPVDKLFGNERLVRHDNLFPVPVADGGRTGINAVTLPVRSRMVTVSPMRIGFSNRIIRPEIKLAKISCRPNPRPTPARRPATAASTTQYRSSRSPPARRPASADI